MSFRNRFLQQSWIRSKGKVPRGHHKARSGTARDARLPGLRRVKAWVGCVAFFATPALAPASTVRYEVTFDAQWNATSHPHDFPSNPHFSSLIGGTHNDSVRFWEVGGICGGKIG